MRKYFTFDRIIKLIVSSILKRKIYKMEYGAAIISEGVFHFMSEKEVVDSGIKFSFDDHGHPELGKVSKAHIFNVLLQEHLEKIGLKVKSRPVEIGYEVRCVAPVAFDLKYCTLLGAGVKELFDHGMTGCIVVVDNEGTVEPLYLEDVEDENGKIKTRLVDITSTDFSMVMNTLHAIDSDDYKLAKKWVDNPEEYNFNRILQW
jgi:6-phosphofructokinase 1